MAKRLSCWNSVWRTKTLIDVTLAKTAVMCGTLATSFTPKKDDTTQMARHTFTKVGQPLNIVFAKKVKTQDEKVTKEEEKDKIRKDDKM